MKHCGLVRLLRDEKVLRNQNCCVLLLSELFDIKPTKHNENYDGIN